MFHLPGTSGDSLWILSVRGLGDGGLYRLSLAAPGPEPLEVDIKTNESRTALVPALVL